MNGQYYEEIHTITDGDDKAVEVSVGITVDHDKTVTADEISDICRTVAEQLELSLKGIYNGKI